MQSLENNLPTPLQQICHSVLTEKGIELWLKRDELIHPHLQGNKWRKLKYNLQEAKAQNLDTLVSFGGARSNHIYSLAAAGKLFGFKTVGVVQGYENLPLTPTLTFAVSQGMKLVFLSKAEYKNRFQTEFQTRLKNEFGVHYQLPDGGCNALAVRGVAELFDEIQNAPTVIPAKAGISCFDVCCVSVGTGSTLAGCIVGAKQIGIKSVIGFSSLKGEDTLSTDVAKMLTEYGKRNCPDWHINRDYDFGGYGKINDELKAFIAGFQRRQNVLLDPIYTSKMLYGILDMVAKEKFERGTKIVAIHTGGLQQY